MAILGRRNVRLLGRLEDRRVCVTELGGKKKKKKSGIV